MQRNFKGIWIPKDIWLSKELSLQEKIFLVEIDSLDNDEGCFASNDYFSEFFNLSKNRCSEVIKGLEKKGLICIKYIYKKGTKSIEKRLIHVVGISMGGIRDTEKGIREIDRGYSGNSEDNNTLSNNTINNTNIYVEAINYLNKVAGTHFKHTSKDTQKHINARLKEKFTIDDLKAVVDKKCFEWLGNEKMECYIRPSTLFGAKFESYLNQKAKAGDRSGSYSEQRSHDGEIIDRVLKEKGITREELERRGEDIDF